MYARFKMLRAYMQSIRQDIHPSSVSLMMDFQSMELLDTKI